ncbi:hypothetical protein [Escherichia coli]|uniref:hypothetical protein n=1 Tax=Escherichia coli TaxID=562 RepID=UPI00288A936C|nr:hypothetical protein [Escherichia coli]
MTLKRACSLLTVKSFSEDERVITGIASTPSPDRDGDILEPEGAEFGSTIPFLWQHDHSRPVGQCTVRRVREGLEITAMLVKPEPGMPSQMAARLDEAKGAEAQAEQLAACPGMTVESARAVLAAGSGKAEPVSASTTALFERIMANHSPAAVQGGVPQTSADGDADVKMLMAMP